MTSALNLFDSNERQRSQGLEFYPGYDFYSAENRPACRVVSGKQLWRSHGHYWFGVSGGGGDDFAPADATNFGGGASGCGSPPPS